MTFIGTHSIDLAGGAGSNFIDFGDQSWLDGRSDFTVLIGVARKATGWFSGSRKLCGRWGSVNKQFLIQVGPVAGGYTVRVQLKGSNGIIAIRDYQGTMLGKDPKQLVARKSGTDFSLWIGGHSVSLVGAVPVPANMITLGAAQPWRVGDTDLLQDVVFHHAWYGVALTDDQIRALWSRNTIADLRLPELPAPNGDPIAMPSPLVWWPVGTGDVLPDVAPLIGLDHGTVRTPSGIGTGALSTLIPKSPIQSGGDAVASYRFEIASWNDPEDPAPPVRKHNGMPALLKVGTDLLMARSKGQQHVSSDQDIFNLKSSDGGQTWPWPFPGAFPGSSHVSTLAYDTVQSARGSTLYQIKRGPYAGRILHFCNLVLNPIPPIGQLERFVHVRHSDSGIDGPWTAWRDTIQLGTEWTSIGGGGVCIERGDGALCIGMYTRSFVPGTTTPQGWYDSHVVGSFDGGATWQLLTTIALGAPSTKWEEPEIGALSYPSGDVPCGTWIALLRSDEPSPPKTYCSYFFPGTTGWTAPVLAFEGSNWPVWIQLAHDPAHPILSLSRSVTEPGHCELRWSFDGMKTFSSPVDLAEAGIDGSDVGHSLIERDDGTVCVVQAHEKDEGGLTSSSARTQFLRLEKLW